MDMSEQVKLLQGLIKIRSLSGKEKKILSYINGYFKSSGIDSFWQGENLIVHLKGRDQTKAFVVNSHVDVVDAGDESRWAHNPWSGDIVRERIYGRGASDMKMGVAASIATARSFSEIVKKNGELPCDTWFTYVVKEEIDGSGTESFAKWFQREGYTASYKDIAFVFTEPTDLVVAEYGHRGNFFIKASIDGKAGHASRPIAIKPHAINEMVGFIDDLQNKSTLWVEKFKGQEFEPPTITPTSIEAINGSPNKVSDHAEATFDLRTIPGFHEEAYQEVEALAKNHGIKLSLLFPAAPTGYTSREARIIRLLQEVVPGLKLEVSQASADLGFISQLGIDGVIFGPGENLQMHTMNESAPLNHLGRAVEIYVKLYHAWAK